MRISDWSSDVCSSDLLVDRAVGERRDRYGFEEAVRRALIGDGAGRDAGFLQLSREGVVAVGQNVEFGDGQEGGRQAGEVRAERRDERIGQLVGAVDIGGTESVYIVGFARTVATADKNKTRSAKG